MDIKTFIDLHKIERKNSNTVKWDTLQERFGAEDLTALWIADMDFKAPKEVLEAMKDRINQGDFGYEVVGDEYYKAAIEWHRSRHGVTYKSEWFRFSNGVVGPLYWFVNMLTEPNESVMILTPVYYPFHNAIKDSKRKLIACELTNMKGKYNLDYNKFEKMLKENNVKLLIHSSPHNPVGKVWTEDELDKIFSICEKNGTIVISDEIHQDLIMKGHKQIPAYSVSSGKYNNNIIVLNSASKTFNLAGLIHSHIIISDKTLRDKYDKFAEKFNHNAVNIMGITATEAAYKKGEYWLESLLELILNNYKMAKDIFLTETPKAVVSPLEGTYLMWVDLTAYKCTSNMKKYMVDIAKVAIDYGDWFCENTTGFIRINLATDPKVIEKAVHSICKAISE